MIVFAALTLAVQTLSPAASCSVPNAEASVVNPARPRLPAGEKNAQGWAEVRVTVSPAGKVTKAVVAQSEGSPAVKQAALDAVQRSTFSPKVVNCKPVAGTYLFRLSMGGM